MPFLSPNPPTRAVVPSPESDTEAPCSTAKSGMLTAPFPTSLGPCWLNDPGAQFEMAEPFASVEPLMSMMAVEPELVKTAEPLTAVEFAVRFQDPDPDTVTA